MPFSKNQQQPKPPAPGKRDLWQYVPDPARTTVYILIAIAMFMAAQWTPQLAEQIEENSLQQELRDFQEQVQREQEKWREENPELAQEAQERWAAAVRQAELESEAQLKLANPHTPMPHTPMPPMPAASTESSTPPSLN